MEFGGEEDYLANMTVPAKMENNSDDAVSSVRGTKYDRIPFAAEHPPALLTRWLTLSSRGNISLRTLGKLDFLSVKNCLDFLLIVRVTCIARRVGVSRAMGACVPGGVPLVPARALPSTRRL
uniref:Uncharacterized protein n=1 Tax=Timema poppense TaxID=170557 RepID=A0A7R9GWT1_TIMPO|nr:unnamed protein product [Timema poppensis]